MSRTVPCLACTAPARVVGEREPEIPRAGALTLITVKCDTCTLTIETT